MTEPTERVHRAPAADARVVPGEFTVRVAPDRPDPRDEVYPPRDLGDATHRLPDSRYRLRDLAAPPPEPPTGVTAHGRVECRHYRELADPAWRQRGEECTGFALAAIADYHLRRDLSPSQWVAAPASERGERTVSRRMLYEMAQLHDDLAIEEGSTLRGALKGWSSRGVTSEHVWPYAPGDEHGAQHGRLTVPRTLDAVGRPGGRYLRVDPTDRAAMQDALRRDFPLFASCQIHVGWFDLYLPGEERIERDVADPLLGGHAFVICGFDDDGWLVHNSWGPEWGADGYGVLPYDDFAVTAQDVWFVHEPRRRTAEPVTLADVGPPAVVAAARDEAPEHLWLHRVSIGDDGGLTRSGRFGMNADEIGTQLYLFRERTAGWAQRRLAIFADAGYWDPDATMLALRPFCDQLMAAEIYPLFLVWDSPWLAGLQGWLYGETGTSPSAPPAPSAIVSAVDGEEHSDADLLQERFGVLARFAAAQFSAPRIWAQVHAAADTVVAAPHGAGAVLAERLAYNLTRAEFEVHLVGHGVGAALLARMAPILPRSASCTLWAPSTTVAGFDATFGSCLDRGQIGHVEVLALGDEAEAADSVGPVPGSLLRLVSEVLEADVDLDTAVADHEGRLSWQPEPVPVIGTAAALADDPRALARLAAGSLSSTVLGAGTHTGLLADPAAWAATIARITAPPSGTPSALAAPPVSASPPRPVDPLDWLIGRSTSAHTGSG